MTTSTKSNGASTPANATHTLGGVTTSSARVNVFARIPPAPTPKHPLLDRLWGRYIQEVPYAATFAKLHGAVPFQNDHIALRTLGAPGGGVSSFARVFERLGWKHAGDYEFPDVHLRAIHLSRPGFPRIFVSELLVEKLPADARDILTTYAIDPTPPPADNFDALAAWFRGPAKAPKASDLDVVARASQYGAWLLAFGRKVNHFTASVADIELWQLRLLQAGVPMKTQIEGEPSSKLRQTATHAAVVDVDTASGVMRMPYAYFEIAERRHGFDGFLAPQARQLFDMTKPAVTSAHAGSHPAASAPIVVVDELQAPYVYERKHPRKDAVVAVEALWADGSARLIAFTSNMSLGGVFLSSPDRELPDIGAPVRLVIDLVERGRFEVRGRVKWKLGARGVGVELVWDSLKDPSYVALASYLDSVT